MIFLLSVIPLPNQPSWESQAGFYSTGLAVADYDGDGSFELFVGEGNDMAAQPNHLYRLPETAPLWSSADSRYSMHSVAADLNLDGWPDAVVSNYIASSGWDPEQNAVYWNRGGALSQDPSLFSETDHSFTPAAGDISGDGLPEVAFACGEAYNGISEPSKVYLNLGDTFSLWWESPLQTAYCPKLADINGDGWLDLVLVGEGMPVQVYYNQGGSLPPSPSWESPDTFWALAAAVGDVDGDGYLDLVIAENGQLGGRSGVYLFLNQGGELEPSPSWSYSDGSYYSTVALGDLNGDGWLDLAAGGWWQPLEVFENFGGSFGAAPSWTWQPANPYGLVSEKLLIWDLDGDGTGGATDTLQLRGNSVKLRRQPAQRVLGVWVDGEPADTFSVIYEEGIVCLPAGSGSQVVVEYQFPLYGDLIVTNWENDRGNFAFLSEMGAREGVRPRPLVRGIYDLTGRRLTREPRGKPFVKRGKVRVLVP